jgi:arabinofuranan 3-O-arabinosyltransferase
MRNPLARARTATTLRLHAGLAAVAYIPLLLTQPGWVSADTKTYLYLDPSKLLSRAWSMWDPSVGLGTVTHQNIGYLWPQGPFYWLMDVLGLPDWVAQRLWWGSIIFVAGAGVAYLLKTLGWRGPGITAAVFTYALTPYLLTLVSRLSAILLPFSALPWMVALAVQAVRHKGWRYPALFALVVATCGSVNATALLLSGLAPLLWLAHSVWGSREVQFRAALRAAMKIGVLTLPASLWWMSGLSVQGTNGIDILRYTETAKVVATVSISNEILRGLGYWFFYGTDRLGPWIEPGVAYTQWLPLIALTYAVPLLGVIGAVVARWRHRAYFILLLAVGLAMAVGAYPWEGGPPFPSAVQAFQKSDAGLAMRSLPRAAPLVVLSLAVLFGAGVASMVRRWPRLNRPAGWGAAGVAILALPALWMGDFVPDNLDRPEDIPEYWHDAAAHVDAEDHDTRVLVLPGTDFASYRWGNTVDPVLPGLIDRPSVQRELIPYGSPASANLLNAFDLRMQERTADPDAIAPIARLLRAGDVLVQSDLQYERYNTPRPRNFWDFMSHAPGLGDAVAFGEQARNLTVPDVQLDDELLFVTPETWPDPPQLADFPVSDPLPIVSAQAATNPLIVAGDGAGLVDAAGAGLIDGTELIRYSASLEDDEITSALDNGGALLLTDSNRKRGERWSTVRHTRGFTETATGAALAEDLTDNRLPLFPEAATDTMTVAERNGEIDAEATSYGNPITFSPEERPILAVDGDTETAWRTAAFTDARGERLDLTLSEPVTASRIRLLQPITGPATRFITEVELRFDGGDSVTVDLGEQSRSLPGEVVEFPERTFTNVSIEIVDDTVGFLPRYAGQSSEGFAEVEIMADDAPRNDRLTEAVRLPQDLLDAAGTDALDHPLGIVVTRQRQDPLDPTRNDEEQSLARLFTLPNARSFSLTGEARLSGRADARFVDDLLGRPHDGSVPWVRSVGDLTGTVTTPAAAFDGDESTAWTTVRSRPKNQWIEIVLPEATTIDHLPLTLVADGLHSVPTEVELWVDGKPSQRVEVGEVTEGTLQNDTVDVDIPLEEVTGSRFRIKLSGVREKLTNDWVSDAPIPQPAAIAEIGLPGPKVPPLPERFDTGCRSDLLEHNNQAVDVQVTGTTADALAGRPLEVRLCGSESLRLEGGEHELRSTRGLDSGIDIDQLVLRSAAGGDADTTTDPLVASAPPIVGEAGDDSGSASEDAASDEAAAAAAPTIDVVAEDADHVELEVSGAVPDEPFWLVLGQSYNEGWTATVGGQTLTAPELVDGFANGWLVVPTDEAFSVRLEFAPQQRVNMALWVSAATVLLCLVLATRRPKRAVVAPSAMPEPYSHVLAFRYHGALPTVRTAWIVGACVGLVGEIVAGLGVGLIVGLAAGLGTRHEKFRRWLVVASPAALGLAAVYVLYIQLIHSPEPSFEWPLEMKRAHPLGWLTVLLLVADVVVGRIWQSRSTEPQD